MSSPSHRPKQSLGQNFLVDANIARKVVAAIAPSPEDVVVEIGPGRGALTGLLAETGCRLVAVEIDKRLAASLAGRFAGAPTPAADATTDGQAGQASPARIEVIQADILDLSFAAFARQFGRKVRVVGNIPYHLTSPILFKTFDEHESVADCTLMVQREVGLRIASKPGVKDYGILSVMARLHGEPELLFNVSPNCFRPKPRVTSSIVRVTMHGGLPEGVDPGLLRAVVRGTFGKRRKTLRNSLRYLADAGTVPGAALAGSPVPLDLRPEQLSPEDFVALARHFAAHR